VAYLLAHYRTPTTCCVGGACSRHCWTAVVCSVYQVTPSHTVLLYGALQPWAQAAAAPPAGAARSMLCMPLWLVRTHRACMAAP
jgi:hypothetical protein